MKLLWGIQFTGSDGDKSGPLWEGWAKPSAQPRWNGEPRWPLLFETRRTAQAWAKSQHDFYKTYPAGHLCREWRFRVMRILMTVKELKK